MDGRKGPFKNVDQTPLSPIDVVMVKCLPKEITLFLDNLISLKIILGFYIYPRHDFCKIRIYIYENLVINVYIYDEKVNIIVELEKENTVYKSEDITHVTTCEQLLCFIEEVKKK